MADGGNTYRFSGETRNLLKEHLEFFTTLGSVVNETKLMPKAADDEARSERSFQADGKNEIAFVYPIDNNEKPADGRIYLKDYFVFDSNQKELKQFRREFEYNGMGNQPEWQAWLEKFKETNTALPEKAQILKFAQSVALSYSRPLTDPLIDTVKQQQEYLVKPFLAARAKDDKIKLLVADPESRYTLIHRGDSLEITLSLVFDVDDDHANGRIFFHDVFTLDAQTQQLKKVERKWFVGRDSQDVAGLGEKVEALNQEPQPQLQEAGKYLDALLPLLLKPEPQPPSKDPMDQLGPKSATPPDFQSAFVRRTKARAERDSKLRALTKQLGIQELDLLYNVALEQLAKRDGESRGWWNRHIAGVPQINLYEEGKLLKAVFEKASAEIQEGEDGFKVLTRLELNPEEDRVRKQILGDRLLGRMHDASREPDEGLRAHQLLLIACHELLQEHGLFGAGKYVLEQIKTQPSVQKEAEAVLAFLEGRGSFGSKVDFLVPVFAREVTKPSMLLAMLAAGPLGVGAESLGVATFGRLGHYGKLLGVFGDGLAVTTGLAGEAAAFTTVHKFFDAATNDPKQVWSHWKSETASAMLLFGAMRFTHWVSGYGMTKVAEGSLGAKWGGKTAPTPELQPQFFRSPVGRPQLHSLSFLEEGALIPQLTRRGRTLSVLAHHGGGVLSMWGAAEAGSHMGLHPANRQQFGGRLFDALVSYTQAIVGFNIANRAASGGLHNTVAEGKLRLRSKYQQLQGKREKTKSQPNISAVTGGQPGYGEARFAFRGTGLDLPVLVPPTLKRILLVRDSATNEGVSYDDSVNAIVNVGQANDTVSRYHAQLERDQSGIWYLADLGSSYGTILEGKNVDPHRPVPISPGAQLRLGDSLELIFEVEGEFLQPSTIPPLRLKILPVQQAKLAPPEQAEEFPLRQFFPGESFQDWSRVIVASLNVPAEPPIRLLSNTTRWDLPERSDGSPSGHIYLDVKGRFVLVNPGDHEAIQVNRQPVEAWSFLRKGDNLNIGGRDYLFHRPLVPEVESIVDPSKNPAALEAAVDRLNAGLDSELDFDQRPTGEVPVFIPSEARRSDEPTQPPPLPPIEPFDGEPTHSLFEPGGPTIPVGTTKPKAATPAPRPRIDPIGADKTNPGFTLKVPDPATSYPPEILAGLLENDPPMRLFEGPMPILRANRAHTSYVLGRSPQLSADHSYQTIVPIEHKSGIENTHAEIFLGKDGLWYVHDRMTEGKTFLDEGNGNFRRLGTGEFVAIYSGNRIALGKPGDPSGIELSFEVPGSGSRTRLDTQTGIRGEIPNPATEFPVELLRHMDADMAPAKLRIGNQQLKLDRVKTTHLFGSDPGKTFPPHEQVGLIRMPNREQVSADHARIFIDADGKWWVADMNSTNGTFLNGEALIPGIPRPLRSGDRIGFGDVGVKGSAEIVFEKPDYLTAEQAARLAPVPEEDEPGKDDTPLPPPTPHEDEMLDLSHEVVEGSVAAPLPQQPAPRTKPQPPPPPRSKPATPPSPPASEAPTQPPPSAEEDPMADWGDMMRSGTAIPAPPAADQGQAPETGQAPAPKVPAPDPKTTAALPDPSSDVFMDAHGQVAILGGRSPDAPSLSPDRGPTMDTAILSVTRPFRDTYLGTPASMTSSAMLNVLRPVLLGEKDAPPGVEQVREALSRFVKRMNAVPKLETTISRHMSGDDFDILGFIAQIREYHQKHPNMDPGGEVDKALGQLLDLFVQFEFKGQLGLESDGDTLRFLHPKSQPEQPDTLIAIALQPGYDVEAFNGIFAEFLSSKSLPVEILYPMIVKKDLPRFLAIKFHSKHFSDVRQRVLHLFQNFPPKTGDHSIPFTQPMVDEAGAVLPGVAVVEWGTVKDAKKDPLVERKDLMIRAFNQAKKHSEGKGFDNQFFLNKILEFLEAAGFDLNQPGFRKASAATSHQGVVAKTKPSRDDDFTEPR